MAKRDPLYVQTSMKDYHVKAPLEMGFYPLGGGGLSPLVIDDTTITFLAANIKAQPAATSNQLYMPHFLYENGNTHLMYDLDMDTWFSRPHILSFFENIGLDRPIPIGRALGNDTHPRPAGIVVPADNKLRIIAEDGHNSPLFIFKANNADDVQSFKLQVEEIGTSQSYPQIFKLQDGSFFVLGQVINSQTTGGNYGDSNFENWSADTQIAQTIDGVNYLTTPSNSNIGNNGWRFWHVTDRAAVAGDPWRKRHLIKTKDFLTFYNFNESFSKTGIITAAEFANFLYYDPGTDGYQPVCTIDENHNFFAISYDSNGLDYVFIFRLNGDPSYTIRNIGLSDYVHDTLSIPQASAIPEIIVISTEDIRIFVRRNPGAGFSKIYQYQTTDLGQSWILIGDVFPDINIDLGGFTVPSNYRDIPSNKTFFVAATQLMATVQDTSNIYVRKAAFGSIQGNTIHPYNGVTGYTFSEYNALMSRSFYAEDPFTTRAGANVSALLDQSPTGANATGGNNPQYLSDDGEYIFLNGTNQRYFELTSVSDILALTEGVVIAVAKKDTSVITTGRILVGSNSAAANGIISFGISKAAGFNNSIFSESHFGGTNGFYTVYGDDNVANDWHILVWMHVNGHVHTHWIDGKKQFFSVSPGTATIDTYNRNGAFFGSTTLDKVFIGRRQNTSSAYFDFKFRHIAICPTPMTFTQLRKSVKFLSDRYSIATVNHFQ